MALMRRLGRSPLWPIREKAFAPTPAMFRMFDPPLAAMFDPFEDDDESEGTLGAAQRNQILLVGPRPAHSAAPSTTPLTRTGLRETDDKYQVTVEAPGIKVCAARRTRRYV